MKKYVLILVSIFLLTGLLLSGCGNEGQGDNVNTEETTPAMADGQNTGDATDDVLKVTLAAQPTSGQVFQFIAEKHGFNKEEGIEVEMAWLSNLSDAASALAAGQVDILSTYGTGGPLTQIANGQDLICLLAI